MHLPTALAVVLLLLSLADQTLSVPSDLVLTQSLVTIDLTTEQWHEDSRAPDNQWTTSDTDDVLVPLMPFDENWDVRMRAPPPYSDSLTDCLSFLPGLSRVLSDVMSRNAVHKQLCEHQRSYSLCREPSTTIEECKRRRGGGGPLAAYRPDVSRRQLFMVHQSLARSFHIPHVQYDTLRHHHVQ